MNKTFLTLLLIPALALCIVSHASPYLKGKSQSERAMIAYNDKNYYLSYLIYKDIYKDKPEYTFILAEHLFNGYGVDADKDKSIQLFKDAALSGNLKSIKFLIRYYSNNDEKRMIWMKLLSKHLNSNEKYALSKSANKKDSSFWLEASSNLNSLAMVDMGDKYKAGDGVIQNYGKSVFWYEKAGLAGNVETQDYLGDLYISGTMVEKDKNKAIYWYNMSACNGNIKSIYKIAYFYYTKKAYVETNAWIVYAKSKINEKNKNEFNIKDYTLLSKAISKHLTFKNIVESQHIAEGFCD